jgi:hypothetical protein
MNVFRFLLLCLILWIAYRALLGPGGRAQTRQAPPGKDEFEPMERCARCGVHMPRSVLDGGLCSGCRRTVV